MTSDQQGPNPNQRDASFGDLNDFRIPFYVFVQSKRLILEVDTVNYWATDAAGSNALGDIRAKSISEKPRKPVAFTRYPSISGTL